MTHCFRKTQGNPALGHTKLLPLIRLRFCNFSIEVFKEAEKMRRNKEFNEQCSMHRGSKIIINVVIKFRE